MNRLWVKLSLAFLAISLAAIGVVAVLSARATREQFRQYVVASGMAGQMDGAQTLEEYYAAQGSWAGVDAAAWRSLARAAWGWVGLGCGLRRRRRSQFCRGRSGRPRARQQDRRAGRRRAAGERPGPRHPDDPGWPRHRDLVECAAGRCGF